jgi:hypothetical protein
MIVRIKNCRWPAATLAASLLVASCLVIAQTTAPVSERTGLTAPPDAPPHNKTAVTAAPVTAIKAANLLADAVWEYSGDGGESWTRTPPTIRGGTIGQVLARASFTVGGTRDVVCLAFGHALPQRQSRTSCLLNDQPFTPPLDGMYYKLIPGIPVNMLKPGRNSMLMRTIVDNRPTKDKKNPGDIHAEIHGKLLAMTAGDLRFQTTPILGEFGDDHITLVCRTNMPATVKFVGQATASVANWDELAKSAAMEAVSKEGLIHRLRVPRHELVTAFDYHLEASVGTTTIRTETYTVNLPSFAGKSPNKDKLRFVGMGDCRTYKADWQEVAQAAAKVKPDLIAFTGDMVSHGRNDWEWDDHFVGACPKLVASVPMYPVMGNHEEKCPLYPQLFYTPGGDGTSLNWVQQIGPVLMIGIDGEGDWYENSPLAAWLEKTLSDSKAKFIFLYSHYPPYSGGLHGALEDDGEPYEWGARMGRKVILPLLAKHKATAMFTGHDHFYERSELPEGITQIISGGAGAPLRQETEEAGAQNPHAKAKAFELHFCLFEVDGDTCTMKALATDGRLLDKRTWKAREKP